MKIEQMKIGDIYPYQRNAKKHDKRQIDNLAESIKQFGMVQPICVDKDNNVIIGHCRLLACKKLKKRTVPVVKLEDLTPDEANKLRLLDNKLNESEWDFDFLSEDIPTLNFDGFDIDWGIDFEEKSEPAEIIEDEVPEEVETRCKLGDLWQLGRHRLMCGDSTNINNIKLLMNGETADIAFSSPPYNAGFTPSEIGTNKKTKYNGNDDNKNEKDYVKFLNDYLKCALNFSKYVFMNVQSISNNKIALIDVLSENKQYYADTIIWDKQNGQPAMGRNILNSVFEYIHIFSHKANRFIGTIEFRGTIDNILHLPPQRHNEYSKIHNATFSVEFASWFISRFAERSVLDNFGGTGTTLIACEQLDKKCYMCELDPKYCDIILQRWENFTHKKAVKINDNKEGQTAE